jgi:hypothetical protein
MLFYPSNMPKNGSLSFDVNGVMMLYQSKKAGEEWFLEAGEPNGSTMSRQDIARFNPQTPIAQNLDGSWKVTSTKVRMNVYTSTGYHPERISTYAQSELSKKGYMQDPNDWKNVEITGFVKLNRIVDERIDDGFSWYARGGKHTASRQCEGTSYKGDLFFSGKTRFAKEQWHNKGYSFTKKRNSAAPLIGRWIGFKFVVYNLSENNEEKIAVVLQSWINEDADNKSWRKADEFIDAGGWGKEGCRCDASSPDQPVSWGGPIVTFRWDRANDVDFRDLSVREIEPCKAYPQHTGDL